MRCCIVCLSPPPRLASQVVLRAGRMVTNRMKQAVPIHSEEPKPAYPTLSIRQHDSAIRGADPDHIILCRDVSTMGGHTEKSSHGSATFPSGCRFFIPAANPLYFTAVFSAAFIAVGSASIAIKKTNESVLSRSSAVALRIWVNRNSVSPGT